MTLLYTGSRFTDSFNQTSLKWMVKVLTSWFEVLPGWFQVKSLDYLSSPTGLKSDWTVLNLSFLTDWFKV